MQLPRFDSRRAALAAGFLFLTGLMGFTPLAAASGQVRDTTGVRMISAAQQDSLPPRPLGPGGAFLRSFILPGYSQSVLKRPAAMVIFSGMEIVGWSMLRRSLIDLDRAKKFARDSVVSEYQIDAATGKVLRDPDTGKALVLSYEPDIYNEALIPARRRHVEDWAALIVFNHLLAGADALVASHLWDVPFRVALSASPDGRVLIGGSIKW
jgi:hypothetical protein